MRRCFRILLLSLLHYSSTPIPLILPSSARRSLGHQPPQGMPSSRATSRAARSTPVCPPDMTLVTVMGYCSQNGHGSQTRCLKFRYKNSARSTTPTVPPQGGTWVKKIGPSNAGHRHPFPPPTSGEGAGETGVRLFPSDSPTRQARGGLKPLLDKMPCQVHPARAIWYNWSREKRQWPNGMCTSCGAAMGLSIRESQQMSTAGSPNTGGLTAQAPSICAAKDRSKLYWHAQSARVLLHCALSAK